MVSEERKKQMREYWNKNREQFSKKRKSKYFLNPEPYLIARRNYRINKREEINVKWKSYYHLHKEEYNSKSRERYRAWYYSKRDKQKSNSIKREYESKRRKEDPAFLMKKRLRLRVWQVLKGIRKEYYDKDYHLDYKPIIEKLLKELPKDFERDNSNYQIDHIIPLFKFDLTKPEELEKAFAPENHQWLSVKEHLIKSSREKSF